MATIYETLRLLAAFGWKTWFSVGEARYLVHPAKPGVVITLEGRLSQSITGKALARILEDAGLDEEGK